MERSHANKIQGQTEDSVERGRCFCSAEEVKGGRTTRRSAFSGILGCSPEGGHLEGESHRKATDFI